MPRKRDPELDVICPECGKSFHTTRQRIRQAKVTGMSFCSNKCATQYKAKRKLNRPPTRKANPENTVIAPCKQCDTLIERKRYNTRTKYGPFCNHVCYGRWRSENLVGDSSPAWKGGYELWYEGNWKRQRKKARQRDNHTCQDCGITEQEWGYALDVHHLIPYDMFDDPKEANDLANLVTLCRNCHAKRHIELEAA